MFVHILVQTHKNVSLQTCKIKLNVKNSTSINHHLYKALTKTNYIYYKMNVY